MKQTRSINVASRAAVLILVALTVVLSACGGPGAVGSAQVPVSTERCVQLSSAQLQFIRAGVTGRQDKFLPKLAWAVQSKELPQVWFVAAYLFGQGKDFLGPAVWAINGELDQPGPTYSVDPIAKDYSNFEDGSKADPKLDMSRDGAKEAAACAPTPES
jgi:hypothetical protein